MDVEMDVEMDVQTKDQAEDPAMAGPSTEASPGSQEPTDFSKLREEIQSIPFFTWTGALTTLVLGVLPTTFDMATDFTFAEPINLNAIGTNLPGLAPYWAQGLTYLFISLPGFLHAFTSLQNLFKRKFCSATCCQGGCCRLLGHCLASVVLAAVITGLVLIVFVIGSFEAVPPSQHPLFYSALLTAISIMSVKILAVFLHSPEMKRLVVRITALESQNEAALQLFLVTVIWLVANGEVSSVTVLSGVSSIMTIGKAGAESLLTFGRVNRLQDVSIWEKLKKLALFSPVFILTSLFRIGSLAVICSYTELGLVVALPVLLVLPLLTLLTVKCCGQLTDLSFGQLVQGVVGELTCLCLWGDRGREGSRKIQLAMAIFSLLVLTVLLALVIAEVVLGYTRLTALEQNTAIFCLCSGWISFPLFIFQIFRMKD